MAGPMSHSMPLAFVDPLDELCSRLLRVSGDSEIDLDIALVTRELETRTLLDQLPDFIYVKDRRGRFVFANAAAGRSSKLHKGNDLIGKTDFDILDHETARELFIVEQEIMSTGVAIEGREERVKLGDGRMLWLTTSKMPLRDVHGQIVGLVGISRDITERKRQDDRRHGHARLLEMIARGQPLSAVLDAIVKTVEDELDDVITSVLLLEEGTDRLRHGAATRLPPAYVKLIDGIEIGPKVGSCGTAAWRREPVFVKDVLADPLWDNYRELALRFGFRSCWSTPIMGADGQVLGTFALYSNAPREPTELELELTAMATDIAGIAIERARTEERIQHMAHHDPLTSLPNRTLFWAQFSRALHEARREKRKVTVAYLDLDNFKQINDTLGHAAGDEVLKTLSWRMVNCVRVTDLLVRLGGDEFAIVFSNVSQDELGLVRRLQELRTAIAKPIVIDGKSVTATCSMGVAFFPQDGDTPEELLARADRAMYEAKDLGRDRLRVSHVPGDGLGI
ncbi:diguanylate cyclase (GGDEF)-like protein/PAS domain S-box-containing protein [Neorhizobium galegae]|uniref:sensor domain-containing protein n=1 Tax=Neorhizobium galegae TaxID=399 RepID=UPI001AE11882|nr:diguanylate cyclase [Neorhizobium galegae]MBP2560397.1 diguanylate cyclase (GGDEF)-like protein/PAS domain S-box-containing protein [Neorhizobium galegae]MDQ0133169.1 diguanylate cyclase (GGDEF)-like protein/PAS domain S-box-containing protein [Neorhizobium galegae]